jgi:16S rRNA (adenine1518-N6/adenine1519-N6)-dimethyltransferase
MINPYSVKNIKSLLAQYDTRPKKSMGQNFVINEAIINKITEAAELNANDIVIEVGPGLGVLTIELAKKAKKVVAIEKDDKMHKILNNTLEEENIKNVEIIHGDIMNIDCQKSITKYSDYKVVANIPYYITQPIIRLFLEMRSSPKEIILLIQKEVAQRICANPPKMNLLAVSVQIYADPEIMSYISKENFWPQPKVDSAVIKITPRNKYETSVKKQYSNQTFFEIVKAGFSSPRKMLIGNLLRKLNIPRENIIKIFNTIGINEKARAENLSITDWQNLVKNIKQ